MAVTLNAAGTQASQVPAAAITYTGLTIAAGSNIGAVFVVAWIADPGAITVNRWDDGGSNQDLTTIKAPTAGVNGQYVAVYGLVNPATGNKTWQLTYSTARECAVNAVAFNGVDQTGSATSFPNSATATGNTNKATQAISLPSNGAAVSVCAAGTAAGFTSVTATQLVLFHGAGAIEAGGSYSLATGTLEGNLDGTDQWVIATTGVAAAAAAGSPFVTQLGAQLIPRGKPNYSASLCTFVVGMSLALSQATQVMPTVQRQWPLPTLARSASMATLTHTQSRPPYYQDRQPFAQSDWPLPRLPGTLLSVTIGTRPPYDAGVAVTVPLPPSQMDWPVPAAKPVALALRTWTQERKSYYTDTKPFSQTSWAPGRAMPPAVGLTTITQDPAQGVLSLPVGGIPTGQALLAIPAPRPALSMAQVTIAVSQQQLVLPLGTPNPIVQLEWPMPYRAKPFPNRLLTILNYYVYDTTGPIAGFVQPLPLVRPMSAALRTWVQGRPPYYVDTVPGHQTDWPIPAPRPRLGGLATWQQSLTESTLGLAVPAPFLPLEWTVPVRRPSVVGLQTWTQNLIAFTLAPAGWARLMGGERNHLVREIT